MSDIKTLTYSPQSWKAFRDCGIVYAQWTDEEIDKAALDNSELGIKDGPLGLVKCIVFSWDVYFKQQNFPK